MATNDNEAAAELLATIQADHVAMKSWYNGSSTDELTRLKERYGAYPDFAREVAQWPGWREVRRAFLKRKETPNDTTNNTSGAPRKRKSRWGVVGGDESGSSRKSRWSSAADGETSKQQPLPNTTPVVNQTPGSILGLLPGLPSNMTPEQVSKLSTMQMRLRVVNQKLNQNLELEAARVDALPRGHPDRSPSPPPIYDSFGKRTNTRAVRWRDRYTTERADLLDQIMEINPAFRAAQGTVRRKRTQKIPIPIDDHPGYNFIGLIIGPRGKTQKELETKTNCKIAIRGKGSVKEGARGGKTYDGMDEPLHVLIAGDLQADVDKAAELIRQMLVVIDDDQNQFKQNQLRELALLNGTLKDDDYCILCAEKGHRQFECPKRFAGVKQVQVKCAICGDSSHPTRDCTQRKNEPQQGEIKDEKHLDSEYMSFMAELDGKKKSQQVDNEQTAVCQPVTDASTPSAAEVLNLVQEAKTGTSIPSVPRPLPPPLTGLPPSGMYIPPPGIPPPPPGVPPPRLPPPGVPPPGLPLPPPPQGIPPPGYPAYQMPPPPTMYAHALPPPQQYQANHAVAPAGHEDELAGWDPNSFYAAGGVAEAGGFNWWENGGEK